MFSSIRGVFSRIDHMLGDKVNFNNFKRIEIIQNKFSNNKEMKLGINSRIKLGRTHVSRN